MRGPDLNHALLEHEGIIWYVVTNTEQELESARSIAIELTRRHSQLVVAIPRKPTDLLKRLQQKQALEEIRAGKDYQTSDYKDLLHDQGLIGKDYINNFHTARQAFESPQNFEWYRGGRTILVTTPAHTSNLATTVMNDLFPATPPHKTSQHLKPGGISKSVKEAVEQILQAPFKLPAKRTKKSQVEAILLDGASALGLIVDLPRENAYDVFDICPPPLEYKDSRKIWLLLDEELQQETPWPQIVGILSQPPYGLYPSVIQLFLASFYHYNQDYFEIYVATSAGGRPLDITADEIIKIVEMPQRYIFRYQPLQDTQKRFLRGMAERALYPGRLLKLQKGETASLRNRVAELLKIWSENEKEVARVVRQATQAELETIAPDVPIEILSAAESLMKVATQPHVSETAIAILESLPNQLGLANDSSQWGEQQLDQAIANLESACQFLKDFKKRFQKYMAGQVGACFDLTEQPKNWDDALKAALEWRKTMVERVRNDHLANAPDARDLLSVLDNNPHNFEQVFLNTLPHRLKLTPFEQWQTVRTNEEYLKRLRQAKVDVEAKAIELGPPVIIEVEPTQPKESDRSTKPPIIIPPLVPARDANKPQVGLTIDTESVLDIPIHSDGTDILRDRLIKPIAPEVTKPTSPVVMKTAVDEAFTRITNIINQLPSKDQILLWGRLVNEYDPQ